MPIDQTRIFIDDVKPQINAGRYATKAIAGDTIDISVDIFKDGHQKLRANVLWRPLQPSEIVPGKSLCQKSVLQRSTWRSAVLTEGENDRWSGQFQVDSVGAWVYTVLAWTDRFQSWREEIRKKNDDGQDVASEILEGLQLIEQSIKVAQGKDREDLTAMHAAMADSTLQKHQVDLALHPRLAELMESNDPRSDATLLPQELPIWVDRERARYGAWYEIFVRSQGLVPGRSNTLMEAQSQLPRIAGLGFNVLYLTPIHPIGRTHRKGRNNSAVCKPDDPGSPWAIGGAEGGHTDIHPELGTIADFDRFAAVAKDLGMELALDFAVQCSPDHPWATEHPEWFSKRPDGTIKYAENPPKKYQDIYPINFDTADRDGLYNALLEVVLFWIEHGITIFRVDNPHTKPISFWEWLIATVHLKHPEVLFLAEAFTRPKRMQALAKVGFTQSYTYFTWRNNSHELADYAEELFVSDVRDYFRPNFFANTPDILHQVLQEGGRPAFIMRLVLAATLSPTYGIYSGFELCENTPVKPGSEEYLNSEKYQYKIRNWDQKVNISSIVRLVNRIRQDNPALQLAHNYQRLGSSNDNIFAYAKTSTDGKNVILCVVNMDPGQIQEGTVQVPHHLHGGSEHDSFQVTDLLTKETYSWQGEWNYIKLDPQQMPAHILRLDRG